MPLDIEFDIRGLTELTIGGKRLVKFTRDFTTVFQRIAIDFRKNEKNLFAREGTPNSFQQLSAKYAAFKKRAVGAKPIMQFSGRLMRSLTGKTSDTIDAIGPRDAKLGTRTPYANRHQVGFKMPKREIIQITDKHKKRWHGFFEKFLKFQIDNRVFPKPGAL